MARADRYRRMAVREDTPVGRTMGDTEHEQILLALEAGDADAAAATLCRQLARAARTVQELVVGAGAELPALDAALEVLR